MLGVPSPHASLWGTGYPSLSGGERGTDDAKCTPPKAVGGDVPLLIDGGEGGVIILGVKPPRSVGGGIPILSRGGGGDR